MSPAGDRPDREEFERRRDAGLQQRHATRLRRQRVAQLRNQVEELQRDLAGISGLQQRVDEIAACVSDLSAEDSEPGDERST